MSLISGGKRYSLRQLSKGLQGLHLDCDFGAFVQSAHERECKRFMDDNIEDDTDGWAMEGDPGEGDHNSALSGQPSLNPAKKRARGDFDGPSSEESEEDPFDSPLSSLPESGQASPGRCEGVGPVKACELAQVLEDISDGRRRSRKRHGKKKNSSKKAKDRSKAWVKRKKAEEEQARRELHAKDGRDYMPSQHALKKIEDMDTIETDFDVANLHAAKGGFIGKRLGIEHVNMDLQAHLDAGREYFDWDGSSTFALVDKNGRSFGLLGEIPNDPTYAQAVQGAAELLAEAKARIKFGKRKDRRGAFQTIASGVSYGGGQRKPGNLSQSAHNRAIMEEICDHPDMKRLANYARSLFATYFPELYQDYAKTLGELYDGDPALRHTFSGSVWPALSINFPPNAHCEIHTDAGNKANGLCPIFALGDYDSTQGGHLVLPDLNLVIRFPPGAVIFIPSASLRHGNIPVRPGESRTSWTQYAAGGLFRWMRYGCCSWETLKKTNKEKANAEQAARSTGWTEAVKMFPTVESIRARARGL